MICRTSKEPHISILEIEGEIDGNRDILILQNAARGLLQNKRILAVDLRQASYVRASICGLLISLLKEARKHGMILALIVKSGQPIHAVLRTAGIDRLIRVFPSRDLLYAWASPSEPQFTLAVA